MVGADLSSSVSRLTCGDISKEAAENKRNRAQNGSWALAILAIFRRSREFWYRYQLLQEPKLLLLAMWLRRWLPKTKAEKMAAEKKTAGAALVEAAKGGNLSEVTRLLARPDAKDFINATDEDEESPMYRRATSVWWATRYGINVKTSDGNKFVDFAWALFGTRPPIAHVAAVLCDPECADQELRNAEQLNQKVAVVKRGGNTFGEKARRAQQAGALALIIINSGNELFAVAGDDSASPVTIPVVLVASDAGATLLQEGSHVTLVGCRIDILKALIGAGADVNLASQHRRPNRQTNVTPISNAASDGHTEAIRALILAGADPNIPCAPSGFTAIHFATADGHAEAIEDGQAEAITALIQGGADPNIADTDKRTPLSISKRSSKAFEALFQGGANPDKMACVDRIYIVRGIDAGRDAWYYVLVEPWKILSFLAALNDDIIHLENYGQILESGYGKTPPTCVTQKYAQMHENKWEHEAALQRTEEQRRLQQERSVAFVMLMHQRLGKASVWSVLEPGILRMVLEFSL